MWVYLLVWFLAGMGMVVFTILGAGSMILWVKEARPEFLAWTMILLTLVINAWFQGEDARDQWVRSRIRPYCASFYGVSTWVGARLAGYVTFGLGCCFLVSLPAETCEERLFVTGLAAATIIAWAVSYGIAERRHRVLSDPLNYLSRHRFSP